MNEQILVAPAPELFAPELPAPNLPTPDLIDEQQRLDALYSYSILDTLPEAAYDELTAFAALAFNVRVSQVSLVDKDRQFIKSSAGIPAADGDRKHSICSHAIEGDGAFIVENARLDERFADNPLITGAPHIVFYAGCPILVSNGVRLGTFCLIDSQPRSQFSDAEEELLRHFARLASRFIEARLIWPYPTPYSSSRVGERLARLSLELSGLLLLDHAGAVIYSNQAPRTLLQLDLEPGYIIHPEGLPDNGLAGFASLLAEVRNTGRTITSDIWVAALHLRVEAFPAPQGIALFLHAVPASHGADTESRGNDDRYRLLLRATSPIFWTYDPEHPTQAGLREWLDFTGLTLDDFRQNPFRAGVHPEDQGRVQLLMARVRTVSTSFSMDLRMRRFDGSYRWMHAQAVARTRPDGSLKEWVGLHTDITERYLLETELRQTHEKFLLAAMASTEGIWDYGMATGELYCSERCRTLLGLETGEADLTPAEWMQRLHPRDQVRLLKAWDEMSTVQNASQEIEFRFLHRDGNWHWLVARAACRRDESGAIERVAGSLLDITVRKITDDLTGLHNRASFLDHLQWRIDKATEEPRSFAVYFLDVDVFKRINDSMGHACGDALLIEMARRLEITVAGAPNSHAARLGGDEFAILIDDLATPEDSETYAFLLEMLLKEPFHLSNQPVHVSASIGIAFRKKEDQTSAAQVLEEADIAMYQAKLGGKARHALFSESMKAAAVTRLEMERDLRQAIETDQMRLFYQPKIDIATGRMVGMEALLRWEHPVRGVLSPLTFIPLAEETGMIVTIGEWVTFRAASDLREWIDVGLVAPDTTMAINISPMQVRQRSFSTTLVKACEKARLHPRSLVLEITESILLEDEPGIADALNQVSNAGFNLELDDFGTGYSSLSYLHKYPFRNVKIDRSFVNRMPSDEKSSNLVSAIISLAKALGMGIVGEGVETDAQASMLMKKGCETAQGFLFSAPQSAASTRSMFATMAKAGSHPQPTWLGHDGAASGMYPIGEGEVYDMRLAS